MSYSERMAAHLGSEQSLSVIGLFLQAGVSMWRLEVLPSKSPPPEDPEPPEPAPDPDASPAHRLAGMNEKNMEEEEEEEKRRRRAIHLLQRRSVLQRITDLLSLSCFHLAAATICHLARAQKQPSPAASQHSRFSFFSVSVLACICSVWI